MIVNRTDVMARHAAVGGEVVVDDIDTNTFVGSKGQQSQSEVRL